MPHNYAARFPAPYIYTGVNAWHTAMLVLSLLLLQLIAMGIMHDFASIFMIISAGTAATLASFLIGYTQGKRVFDIHALLTGLLIGFFLPVNSGFVFSFFDCVYELLFQLGDFRRKRLLVD